MKLSDDVIEEVFTIIAAIGRTLSYAPERRKTNDYRRFTEEWSDGLTFSTDYVQSNIVGIARLQDTLERLAKALRDVEIELAAMKAEHDPLASHIFISRRQYRNAHDTKGGKRREINARLSFDTACELGFLGSLDEWERLMGAVPRR